MYTVGHLSRIHTAFGSDL